MSKVHDKPALSSEQVAAHREIVERARQERPGPDELIDRGQIDELVSQAQFIEVRALCAQLRKLREHAGLSLTEFSEQSGLTRTMISRLENGWNLNPTLETLFRYAEALGVGLKLVLDESAPRAKADEPLG